MPYETAIITFLAKILSGLLIQEANHLRGLSTEITTIRGELEWIDAFLKDAAKDKKRHQYMMMKVWVNQIRDEGYNAEDIIETYILKVEQHQHRNFAFRLLSNSRNVITIHHVGMQLKEINDKLQRIATSRQRYGLENINLGGSSVSSSTIEVSNAKSDPPVEETNVQGFDKDAEKLETALSRGESRRSVVSIVGMGGLGKTTLAKYVFDRMLKTSHFKIHSWIYVSKEYRVKDLFLRAMKQVKQAMAPLTREQETEMGTMTEEQLKSELLKNLSGKRYLFVIDEIWTKEAWDLIEKAFPDDQNGSRIMLTTRNRGVAEYADQSSNPHDLHLLNKGDSWKLFCKKVSPADNSCRNELTQSEQDIFTKTGGLPLAITVLGELLCKNTRIHWEDVCRNVYWHLFEESKRCPEALALSYNDLSDNLKLVFLYFGMFPKGMEIEADKLIQLWIAEGFIEEQGTKTMEVVAEDYLEELIQRSMVQGTRRKFDGSVETCSVHDLLREFAISEAKRDGFLEIYGIHQECRSRRLATHLNEGTHDTKLRDIIVNLRSLLCFTEGIEKDIWGSGNASVKLLRVLDLSNICIPKLPKEIGDLILLKYLGLRKTRLQELPDSIGNLLRLQTLDLRETDITMMPSMIGKLKQLRHLYCRLFLKDTFCGCDLVRDLGFHVCTWMKGGIENLANLRRLRIEGELRQYWELLSDSLSKLRRLQSLELVEDSEETPLPLVSFSKHEHLTKLVLSGPLKKLPNKDDFPPYLVSLELSRSFLEEDVDPMTTLQQLPKLRALKMEKNTYSMKMTCLEGGFMSLHHLEMSHHTRLVEWIVNEGAMCNLRSLRMDSFEQLEMLPDSLKHIPTLNREDVSLNDMRFGLENWWLN